MTTTQAHLPEGTCCERLTAMPVGTRRWLPGPPDERQEIPQGTVQKPLWSSAWPVPAPGQRVLVSMNDLGPGIVVGYFVEHGWLGVRVAPEAPPQWWLDRNLPKLLAAGKSGDYCVFGAELSFLG